MNGETSVIERAAQTAKDLLNQVEGLRGAWLIARDEFPSHVWDGLTKDQKDNVLAALEDKCNAYQEKKAVLLSAAPSLLREIGNDPGYFEIRVELEALLFVNGRLPKHDSSFARNLSDPNQARVMAAPETFLEYPSDMFGWQALNHAITEIDNGL